MDDIFEIPVTYKNKELLFPARLMATGYTHKFLVEVYDQELFFEPDDGGEYRALVNSDNLEQGKKMDVDLLQAIATSIKTILQ